MIFDKLNIFANSDYKHKAGRGCIGTFDDRCSRQWTPLDYSGKADGKTDNTQALQKTIDTCSQKGGTVFLGAGVWLTGPLMIPANVRIRLERGAILKADMQACARAMNDVLASDEGKLNVNSSFILVNGVNNVHFEGNGVIDGSFMNLSSKEAKELARAVLNDDLKAFEGLSLSSSYSAPFENLICLNNVTNASVKGLTIITASKNGLVMEGSHKILLEDIRTAKTVTDDDNKVLSINCATAADA